MSDYTTHPCSVCALPIGGGTFIGTGDGTMKDGGSFAHEACYYRERVTVLEKEVERVRALAHDDWERAEKYLEVIDAHRTWLAEHERFYAALVAKDHRIERDLQVVGQAETYAAALEDLDARQQVTA